MNEIDIPEIVLIAPLALVAITFHEAAHGYIALYFGDDTALKQGRVSLNPLKHIDPIGTLVLPAFLIIVHAPFLFGWAKPVPVTWSALRQPKRDMIWVAAAGPAANLILGGASSIFAIILNQFSATNVPWLINALGLSVEINLILAIFNLLPIPPLDGSKVVAGFLPEALSKRYLSLGRFGFLPVLVVIIVFPVIMFLIGLAARMLHH